MAVSERWHPASIAPLIAVFVVCAAVVWSLPATSGTNVRNGAEVDHLAKLRERLLHGQSLQETLHRQVEDLEQEIDALAARRAGIEVTLRQERDEARFLERTLDRLVPRLLARALSLKQRREAAAEVLAQVTRSNGSSQSNGAAPLDPSARARLLAVSPFVVQRLWSAEARMTALHEQRDRAIARHRKVELQAPLLQAKEQRLRMQHDRKRRQQQTIAARSEQLTTELVRLEHEERRFAQRSLAADEVRAGVRGPDDPAANSYLSAEASVKGLAIPPHQLAHGVNALQPSSTVVAAAAPSAKRLTPPDLPVRADSDSQPRAIARPAELTPKTTAFLDLSPVAGLASRVTPGRLPGSQPALMPWAQPVARGFADPPGTSGQSFVTIQAAPGQGVAAPEGGRVVFAGIFKSYGLLLIIEHDREYHTLLWGFSRLHVGFGDEVDAGQVIGAMGRGDQQHPRLHVELRHNGQPVNPLLWLAATNSKVRG